MEENNKNKKKNRPIHSWEFEKTKISGTRIYKTIKYNHREVGGAVWTIIEHWYGEIIENKVADETLKKCNGKGTIKNKK